MPPSFDFYVDDFLAGTMHMTDAELGVYVRLLAVQFQRGSVPADEDFWRRFRASRPESNEETDGFVLQDKFEEQDDGSYKQARMSDVREQAFRRWRANCENGRKGGRPRKIGSNGQDSENTEKTHGFSGENPNETHGLTDGITHGVTQTKPNGKKEVEDGRRKTEGGIRKTEDGSLEAGSGETEEGTVPKPEPTAFDRFWKVVCKKTSKESARKAFKGAVTVVKTEKDISATEAEEFLIERMTAFAKSPAGQKTYKYCPGPAPWLNQGKYDDDPELWQMNTVDKPARQQRDIFG